MVAARLFDLTAETFLGSYFRYLADQPLLRFISGNVAALYKSYSGLEFDSEPAEQLAVGIGLAIHIIILLLIPMTLINLFVPDLVHGPCNHEGCRERDVLNHGVSDSGEFDPLLDSDDDEEEDDDPEHEHENEHEHDYSDHEDKPSTSMRHRKPNVPAETDC
ncbi:unnamed protein product, partial [Mesorhabditis spiculigera]